MNLRILLMLFFVIFYQNSFAYPKLESQIDREVTFSGEALLYQSQYMYSRPSADFYINDIIDVKANIGVVADLEKTVPVYIVALYNDQFYMKNSEGGWKEWDADLKTLVSIGEMRLSRYHDVDIASQLQGLPGSFAVFFGYKVDGIYVYNTEALEFEVFNTNRPPRSTRPPSSGSGFEAPTISSRPILQTAVNANYIYTIIGQSSNSSNLLYSFIEAPDGAQIDQQTGVVQWTPASSQQGLQKFSIKVTDSRGQSAIQTFDVTVNAIFTPTITSSPILQITVANTYLYSVIAQDQDSDELQYSFDKAPAGAVIDNKTGVVQWVVAADQEGVQSFSIKVTDDQGLSAIQSFDVIVNPILGVSIVANPTTGVSPLTVRFSPNVINNNIVLNNYAWDFNSDGTNDVSDTFGAPKTYTYTGSPGDTFIATLTVTPAEGDPLVATKEITIENRSPTAQVSSSVSNGHAPLMVTFTVVAQDAQGIKQIDIDFDGDGTFDEAQEGNSSTSSTWTFQTEYQNQGDFLAKVKVTDIFDAETIVSNNAITVDVNDPLDPIVLLIASPIVGNAPLDVTLTASATLFDGSEISQWRWDLDGDGSFETTGEAGETDSQSFSYLAVDYFYPVVEVTTQSGRNAKASIRIETRSTALPTISIPDTSDTINTDAAEISSFTATLAYQTELEIWMENAFGTRIKTIQAKQQTAAGSYQFAWDGTNEQNEIVSEGDYYVVLGYSQFGTDKEIDLRTTTGGRLSYYRRPTANPRQFNRLESPLVINYAVDQPAEISFFWQISFGARLMTLMEHERMGRGQYSLYWNADYPSGEKVPGSLNNLMPGIVRYALPDNVIFVKSMPRIENYVLKSTVIADPRRESIGFDITLSKATTVELVVSDMDKGIDVATRIYSDLSGGEHSLSWDGKNNHDQYLAPSDYRIGVRSIDKNGNRSLFWYRTQRIYY